MELIICKNENEWTEKISQSLAEDIARFSVQRLFLPAGETPRPLYSLWSKQKPHYLDEIQFIQVDEILDGQNRFQNFFKETMAAYVDKFIWINEASVTGQGAILGLGTNGHVAFHEPGLPLHFYSGCIQLDDETCARLKIPNHSRAVSYGLSAFLKSRFIYLIVRGQSKKEILRRVLNRDEKLPAARLLRFSNLKIFTDFEV